MESGVWVKINLSTDVFISDLTPLREHSSCQKQTHEFHDLKDGLCRAECVSVYLCLRTGY